MTGKELIDRARALGYSDAQTARLIGVKQPYLSMVYAGTKPISPESAALIADLVGEDGADVAHRIMVEREKNPARKTALARVLFSLAGLCVGLAVHEDVRSYTLSPTVTQPNGIYIVRSLRQLARILTGRWLRHLGCRWSAAHRLSDSSC